MSSLRARRFSNLASFTLMVSVLTSISSASAQDSIDETGVKGAGSTFAYPLLSRWSHEYREWLAGKEAYRAPNSGLDDPLPSSALEYEPVGSLAGMLRVNERAVDFGATDMPLPPEELAKLQLAQFPIIIGGVVVAVNVDGLSPEQELRLTGPVLAQIFLGTITRWSDPALQNLNPKLKLPDAPIAVMRRSDGSGTTFNFTTYLSKVSPTWNEKVGSGLSVSWPVGKAAKGNEGVAKLVRSTRNAIGYVEYAQATQLALHAASLQNRDGKFIRPRAASFQAAAMNVDWTAAQDFHVLLVDRAGGDAYPITATVFALMHKRGRRSRTDSALQFFRWSLARGGATASTLGYVPLPASVIPHVSAYWTRTLGAKPATREVSQLDRRR